MELSVLYLIPAIAAVVWPVAALLGKQKMSIGQWMVMGSLLLIGATMALYSCYFYPLLKDEFAISVCYILCSLACPAVFYLSVCGLTTVGGVTRSQRRALWPVFIVGMLMIAALMISHRSDQTLFMERAILQGDLSLIPGNWHYNMLLILCYYAFLSMLVLEVIGAAWDSAHCIVRFNKQVDNHYSNSEEKAMRMNAPLVICAVLAMAMAVIEGLYPLHKLTSVPVVTGISVAQIFVVLVVGYYFFNLTYTASDLEAEMQDHLRPQPDPAVMEAHESEAHEQMDTYVSQRSVYSNPDLSVADLANHFQVSQECIISLVHELGNVSFYRYINGYRVEDVVSQLLAEFEKRNVEMSQLIGDRHTFDRFLWQAGFASRSSFELAFHKVMHLTFDTWVAQS